MMAETDPAQEGVTDTAITPGDLLKNARERAGMTQRQVAAKLKLLPQQVDALEQDNFSAFNGEIFCKAHLSAYADLMDMDREALLALYRGLSARRDPLRITGSNTVVPVQRAGRGHSLRYWGVAVVALVAAALWLNQPKDFEQPLAVNEVVDPNDQSSLQSLDTGAVLTEGVESSLMADFDEAEEDSVVIDLPSGDSGGTPASLANSGTPDRLSSDLLEFEFTEDCWVEVKDGNGTVIYAALKRASDSLVLSGMGPFKVLLGYAHGVSLNYNGAPIEINVDSRNNSARLVVGNLPVH